MSILARLLVTVSVLLTVELPTIIGQSGSFTLQVLLVAYRNPTSEDCDGCNCELYNSVCNSPIGRSPCDNRFTFCLQWAGALTSSLCTYGKITSANDIEDDDFLFSSSITSQLGLSNPLSFSSIPPGVPIQLIIDVIDVDRFNPPDDMVDRIYIQFPAITMTTSGYSSLIQSEGQCGRSTIQIRYQIQCSDEYVGPRCDCRPQPGRYICNSNGSMQCEGLYTGSECTNCTIQLQPDRFTCNPNGTISCQGRFTGSECTKCEIEMQPNRFTCNPNGTINCLGNFTGRLCSECILNHYGDNCSVHCISQPPRYTCNYNGTPHCGDTFTGPRCDRCIEDYHGPNCDCTPQPDRYTCNPDGTINCTGNFNGSLCSTCIPNHYGVDCSVYCFYPESASHFCDTYGNKVCKNSISPSCSATIIYLVIGCLTILPCLMCLCFVTITHNIKNKKMFAHYQTGY